MPKHQAPINENRPQAPPPPKLKLPTREQAEWVSKQLASPMSYKETENVARLATGNVFTGELLELLVDWSLALAHSRHYKEFLEHTVIPSANTLLRATTRRFLDEEQRERA